MTDPTDDPKSQLISLMNLHPSSGVFKSLFLIGTLGIALWGPVIAGALLLLVLGLSFRVAPVLLVFFFVGTFISLTIVSGIKTVRSIEIERVSKTFDGLTLGVLGVLTGVTLTGAVLSSSSGYPTIGFTLFHFALLGSVSLLFFTIVTVLLQKWRGFLLKAVILSIPIVLQILLPFYAFQFTDHLIPSGAEDILVTLAYFLSPILLILYIEFLVSPKTTLEVAEISNGFEDKLVRLQGVKKGIVYGEMERNKPPASKMDFFTCLAKGSFYYVGLSRIGDSLLKLQVRDSSNRPIAASELDSALPIVAARLLLESVPTASFPLWSNLFRRLVSYRLNFLLREVAARWEREIRRSARDEDYRHLNATGLQVIDFTLSEQEIVDDIGRLWRSVLLYPSDIGVTMFNRKMQLMIEMNESELKCRLQRQKDMDACTPKHYSMKSYDEVSRRILGLDASSSAEWGVKTTQERLDFYKRFQYLIRAGIESEQARLRGALSN